MKINSIGATIVAVVLSTIYYGCVVVQDRTVFSPTAVITGVGKAGIASQTKLTKLDAQVEAGSCAATLSLEPSSGKVIKGSLKIASDPVVCKREETDPPLTINGKKVLDIGAVQFTTEGSCRYCWVNSAGGMSCVVSSSC